MEAPNKPLFTFSLRTFGRRFLVFVICCGTLEIVLRLIGFPPYEPVVFKVTTKPSAATQYSPVYGYELKPGVFHTSLNDSVTYTAHHKSDGTRKLNVEGLKSAPNVAILGCSFAYGYGLNDEQTFPSLLQDAMPQKYIRNFGISGYGLAQMYLQMDALLEGEYLPETIVLAYASFQDERATLRRNWRKSIAPHNRHFGLDTVRFPAICNDEGPVELQYLPVDYQPWPFSEQSALVHAIEKTYNYSNDAWFNSHEVAQNILVQMDLRCRAAGVRFIVAGMDEDDYTLQMLVHCDEHGVETIDLGLDLHDPAFALPTSDYHPNAKANQHYAKELAKRLSNL